MPVKRADSPPSAARLVGQPPCGLELWIDADFARNLNGYDHLTLEMFAEKPHPVLGYSAEV